MSLSDCVKCWATPCACGYEYEKWPIERLNKFIETLQEVRAKNFSGFEGYDFKDESFVYYRIFGINKGGRKVFVYSNGLNPYEWRPEGSWGYILQLNQLEAAQSEADHAPEYLTDVTIEQVNVFKNSYVKVETKTVEYEPKGLGEIIPF